MFKVSIIHRAYRHIDGDAIYELVKSIAGDALSEDHYDVGPGPGESYVVISDDSLKQQILDTGFDGRGLAIQSMKGFNCDKPEVTFKFESIDEADAFKSWMCNSGEQSFFGIDDAGNEFYYSFEYHDPGGSVVIVKKYDD